MIHFRNEDFSILIVDDVPKNIQVLGSILRPLNYKVEFAMNGKQALDWARKRVFDLVLLDIMMPEISGYEVCEQIRRMESYNDTPVIFLTAKTDNDSVVKGFELGAQDYVTKPFETNELLARVKTQLQLKQSKALLGETNKWLEQEVAARTAELLAAKKELEELDTVKNEFLNLLNHEIRTPLNGILGGLNIIREFQMPQEMETFFQMLDVSARRLEKFSYKALDISALRAKGGDALDLKTVDLVALAKDMVDEMKDQAGNRNIAIYFSSFSDTINVTADKTKLQNVIRYILDNAIRFSERDSRVHTVVKQTGGKVICVIKDQGPGFSDYAMQNLFTPFSNTRHHVDSNAGLSLYYARLAMDAHGGSISVEGNNPAGSVVTLTLPVNV